MSSKSLLKSSLKPLRRPFSKDNLNIKVEKLKNDQIPAIITLSEQSRRMQDMMKMYSMGQDLAMFGGEGETLVLNANNELVQYIEKNSDAENVSLFCEQLYDLALLGHAPLKPEEMTKFIARSNKIMQMLAK